MRPKLAAQELVEMQHAVFGGRLVGAAIFNPLLVECLATFMHFQADDVIFNRSFVVGFFLGFHIPAFKQHDVFGIIKLHDIAAGIGAARHHGAHHQRIGIPLHHDVGIIGQPDRTVLGYLAAGVAQYLLMPRFVDFAAGFAQTMTDADSLHAVPVAEIPLQVIAIYKMAQARMEGRNVVILKIHFNKGFPVEAVLFRLHPVQHVAGEIHVFHHADIGQIFKNVASAGE